MKMPKYHLCHYFEKLYKPSCRPNTISPTKIHLFIIIIPQMVRFFNSMITTIVHQSKILSTSDTESNRTFHGKDYSAYRHSIEHFISKISPPHISREGLIFVLLLAVRELNHSALLLRNRSKHILKIFSSSRGIPQH